MATNSNTPAALARLQSISNHLSEANPTASNTKIITSNETVANRKTYRTELNPVSFLKRSSQVYPSRPGYIYNDLTVNYSQFASRVRHCAASLIAAGMQKGDKVGVLLPNIPAILESYFSIPLAGCILVAINTRLNEDEVKYILQFSKVKLLIVDKELVHLAASAGVPKMVIADETATVDPYEVFVFSHGKKEAPGWDWFPDLESEDDVITINFTSGTTGRPKGVMYHYRGAYLNALGEAMEMRMGPESRYLWTVPMFHASGWCFPWAIGAVSACSILLRKVDYGLIWKLFREKGVTHYGAAPTVQTMIVHHPDAKPLGRQITTMVAAAPPSPTLLESMMKLGLVAVHVYGLTETYGPITVCAWQEEWKTLSAHEQAAYLSRQGQGYIVADEVRVVNPDMTDTPWDGQSLGEVVMRGNIVMKGYLDDTKATEEAFRGGWFHSGDLGVRHPDGYIELRDRMKDIIISGGENISTIEVEQAVVSFPQVLEASVVATPDDKWGERPVVYLTLVEEALGMDHAVLKERLMKHLRGCIAGYKMPVRVEILDALPKTSTGKVQKFVLREREWKKAGKIGKKRING
ncbi:hypothetical protein HDV05_005020 [Chytridiales sp. JEL 0842]|nr:hypothetical protein HDV05_005020 [Chytridiales sp. JEL 0842]